MNLRDEEDLEDFVGAWVRFANACPRHYALMFSPTFAEHSKVAIRMDALGDYIRRRAEDRLRFVPGKPQIQAIFGVIHGAASLVGAGLPRQSDQSLVEPLNAYLSTLKGSSCRPQPPAKAVAGSTNPTNFLQRRVPV